MSEEADVRRHLLATEVALRANPVGVVERGALRSLYETQFGGGALRRESYADRGNIHERDRDTQGRRSWIGMKQHVESRHLDTRRKKKNSGGTNRGLRSAELLSDDLAAFERAEIVRRIVDADQVVVTDWGALLEVIEGRMFVARSAPHRRDEPHPVYPDDAARDAARSGRPPATTENQT